MELTVKAVVLKETAYGEGDKVLTLLAENIGRIQVWAKGARRVKSALLSASHPFTYAEFALSQKRGSYYCNSAKVLESHFKLRSDLERLSLAGYFSDVICHAVQENQQENEVLRLFLNSLYLLTYSEKTQAHIKAVFEMRLMRELGYAPELHGCVKCGTETNKLIAFDYAGGMLCESCARGKTTVTPAVYKALTFISEQNISNVFSFTLTPDAQKILSNLCEEYLEHQLDIRFKTLEFYKSLLGGIK